MNLGAPELLIILVVILVLFGGAKLPKLARSLGQAQKEFKQGIDDPEKDDLTYTFINAGVTRNPPRPQAMILGTPSDAPKPALVPRSEWGAPEGESSRLRSTASGW